MILVGLKSVIKQNKAPAEPPVYRKPNTKLISSTGAS